MGELDEPLRVFARISGCIERVDPDAVEHIARLLNDRVRRVRASARSERAAIMISIMAWNMG